MGTLNPINCIVRLDGDDLNAGWCDSLTYGVTVPYNDQAAAQFTGRFQMAPTGDASEVTPVGYSVVAGDQGNYIRIPSTAGSPWQPGVYRINATGDIGGPNEHWRLDRNPWTGGSQPSIGTQIDVDVRLGGAIRSPGGIYNNEGTTAFAFTGSSSAAGLYIEEGTYITSDAGANTPGGSFKPGDLSSTASRFALEPYRDTPGDYADDPGDLPRVTIVPGVIPSGNIIWQIRSGTSNAPVVRGITVDGEHASAVSGSLQGIDTSGSRFHRLEDCEVIGLNSVGFDGGVLVNCRAIRCGQGFATARAYGCVAIDCTVRGFTGMYVNVRCVAIRCAVGFEAPRNNYFSGPILCTAIDCPIALQDSVGYSNQNSWTTLGLIAVGCDLVFDNVACHLYGFAYFDCADVGLLPNDAAAGGAYGNTPWWDAIVELTADPFVDKDNLDLRLNEDAGGGATVRTLMDGLLFTGGNAASPFADAGPQPAGAHLPTFVGEQTITTYEGSPEAVDAESSLSVVDYADDTPEVVDF